MFDFINTLTLQAAFTSEREGHLPEYLGSTIRGIMGHCFRDIVCSVQNRKCFACDKQYDCPYVYNYCNTRGEGGAVNPFVLYPHTEGKTEWKAGDVCIFDITLFGQAALHPEIFLEALKRMISPLAAVDRNSGNIGPQPEFLIEQMQEKLGCKVVMKECMLKIYKGGWI